MITLHDGPAKGTFMTKRAPLFLRAVVGGRGGNDVLDLLTDQPSAGETVFVYRRRGGTTVVHINMGRKGSGFYSTGDYEQWTGAVDVAVLLDAVRWQRWASEQAPDVLDAY